MSRTYTTTRTGIRIGCAYVKPPPPPLYPPPPPTPWADIARTLAVTLVALLAALALDVAL